MTQQETTGLHLRDYWKVVWQARWMVLALFLAVLGGTALWTFLQVPIYRATAVIEVQPQARRLAAGQDVSGLGAAGYGWFAEEKYHNTQVEILRSRDVGEQVVRLLDLRTHPAFAEAADPVEAFRKRIHAVPRRETGLIEVSLTGPDPDQITQWVNAVARAYVRRNLEQARRKVDLVMQTIREQMQALEQDFSEAESERFSALKLSPVFNTEEQEEIVREKLKTYNTELTQVRIELSRLRDTLRKIRRMREAGTELVALPELADDPTLKELQRGRVELERSLESAKVELRPGHPQYERKRSELLKVEQRIRERIEVLIATLETRFELARNHETFLRDELAAAESDSLKVAQATSGYGVVKTRAETKKRVFDLINKTMNEVQLGAQLLDNNVSILDEAVPPTLPIRPRRRLNLLIGAMFGLFLGVSAAFFLDYLDNTFRTPEDVERHLALPLLGAVPRARDLGLENRAVKEAFQSLRTSVIFSSKNHQRRIVLVTSSGPREGKSSTTALLARTMAAAGDRVILLDCDLRRPTQHALHGVTRDKGLTNFLAAPEEERDWSVYVKRVGPGQLELMGCGPLPPSPPELLGSRRFAALLAELRERYDWVLIDSPPASGLADAALLASRAEMLLLVIQHHRTPRDLVRQTLQRLRGVNTVVAGAVLNDVDLDRASRKDHYYMGYYYYEEEKGRRRRSRRAVEPEVGVG